MSDGEKKERNIAICRLRRTGKTYKEVGAAFGIHRSRVVAIIAKEIRTARKLRPDLFENEDWENLDRGEGMKQALLIMQRMGI